MRSAALPALFFVFLAEFARSQDYYFGSVSFGCPEGWWSVGDSCFITTNESQTFNVSNELCASSRYSYSHGLTMHSWFLTKKLSQELLRWPGRGSVQDYWTGFFAKNYSAVLNSSTEPFSISIYNPVWAEREPPLRGDMKLFCVSLHIDYEDDLLYGWHVSNCSERIRAICETFSCLQGELRCADNSRCYSSSAKCDSVRDCVDGSDEADCPDTNENLLLSGRSLLGVQDDVKIYNSFLEGRRTKDLILSNECVRAEECVWIIRTLNGQKILLELLSVNVDSDDEFTIDGVVSEEGTKQESARIGNINPSRRWLSTNDTVLVRYRSSPAKTPRGFQLEYSALGEANCARTFGSLDGQWITAPLSSDGDRYAANLNCKWTIVDKSDNVIAIQVHRFVLAANDTLSIYDGSFQESNLLGVFSSANPPPLSFISSSSEVNVVFNSKPHSPGGEGFEIRYKQGCTNESVFADGGSIQAAQNRRSSRQRHYHCSWTVAVPCATDMGCPFTFVFETLRLSANDVILIESGTRRLLLTADSPPVTKFRTDLSDLFLDLNASSTEFSFLASFSKDCPTLDLEANSSATFSEEHEYLSAVDISCNRALRLVGDRRITCEVGGKWSAVSPSCVSLTKTSCMLPFIENGFILNVSSYLENGTITYDCQLGYKSDNPKWANCTSNGSWLPPPVCSKIDCGAPSEWYNGAKFVNSTRDSRLYSVARYECPEKMWLTGEPPFRACLQNGSWTSPNFSCEAVYCYEFSFPFGRFNNAFFPNGSFGEYTCDVFFHSHEKPQCVDSEWTGAMPNCTAADPCSNNPCGNGECVPRFGGYTCNCSSGYKQVSRNERLSWTCEDINECETDGYSLCDYECVNTIGSYYCRCPENYVLYESGKFPADKFVLNTQFLAENRSCVERRCPIPLLPETVANASLIDAGGLPTNGLFIYGSIIVLVCKKSDKIVNMTCSDEGWISNGSCSEKICARDKSSNLSNLSVFPDKEIFDYGEKVSFSCDGNWRLVGISPAECLANGTWLPKRWPLCALPRCPKIIFPPTVEFNSTDGMEDTPNFTYFVRCKEGYEFEDQSEELVVECLKNFTWNVPRIPLCIQKGCPISVPDGITPQLHTLAAMESIKFSCLELDYIEEGPSSVTCYIDPTLVVDTTTKPCIQKVSPETYVDVNSSAALWCRVASDCLQYQVSWRRSQPSVSNLTTTTKGNTLFGMFIDSAQLRDQGSYMCVVSDSEGQTIDRQSVDLFVYPFSKWGRSWTTAVAETVPRKEILFASSDDVEGWSWSSDWHRKLDGSWSNSEVQKDSLLATPIIVVNDQWMTTAIRFSVKPCAACSTTVTLYSTNNNTASLSRGAAKFVTIGRLLANETEFRTSFRVQEKYIFVAIEGDRASVDIFSITVYTNFCPSIRVGLAEFPEVATQEGGSTVYGTCVKGASTADGSHPSMYCKADGQWELQSLTALPCICDEMHVEYNGKCVEQGYLCYACNESQNCDDRNLAQHCEVGESCFTDTKFHPNGTLITTKGCKRPCETNYVNFTQCARGKEACTLCCLRDYCNSSPDLPVQPVLIGSYPRCIDTVEISITCESSIIVYKHGSSQDSPVFVPVVVPFPNVTDNSPYYTLESDPEVGSLPYSFDGLTTAIEWKATDRNGTVASCKTAINYTDDWAPLIRCPTSVVNYVLNPNSSTVAATFPTIEYLDASPVIVTFSPENGTRLNISVPYIVNVTATDQSFNTAFCSFSYITIAETLPHLQMEVELSANFSDDSCWAAVINQLRSALKNITNQTCPSVDFDSWQHYTNGSLLTVFFVAPTADRAAVDCASSFTNATDAGKIIVKNPCDGPTELFPKATYTILCDDGRSVNVDGTCEICQSGFFATSDGCEPCSPIESIDKNEPQYCSSCESSSRSFSTESPSKSFCYEWCGAGFYSSTGLAPCHACPVGSYQPNNGSKHCVSCDSSLVTPTSGTASPNDCAAPCQPGMFSRTGSEPCESCPLGYYQPKFGQVTCSRCPPGNTTAQINSTSDEQCIDLSCAIVECKNGGICSNEECFCTVGFAGADCGVALNLCAASYCLNNGTCSFDVSQGTSCRCTDGFGGSRCEMENLPITTSFTPPISSACNLSFCVNGMCKDDGEQGFFCECNVGYKQSDSNTSCMLMDACDFLPCSDGVCVTDADGGHTCRCKDGTKGKECRDKPEAGCAVGNDEVANCSCLLNFPGAKGFCTVKSGACPVDACKSSNCTVFSSAAGDYYFCNCEEGRYGETCSAFAPCSEIREPSCGFGRCAVSDSLIARCSCNEGFSVLSNCSQEIDSCSVDSNQCQDGECQNKFNGSSCVCDFQHRGDKCQESIQLCNVTGVSPCGVHGKCVAVSGGGYNQTIRCDCEDDWTGPTCEEPVSTCVTANKCPNVSDCASPFFNESFCFCNATSRGDSCNLFIDYCAFAPCENGGSCSPSALGGFHCSCKTGYNGSACEEIVKLCDSSPCQNGGICTDLPGGYQCDCPINYKSAKDCSAYTDPCNGYCSNGGICTVVGSFPQCQCSNSFTGDTCTINKTLDYRLYFTGILSEQSTVSISFPASTLTEFSLCGWVKPGADDTPQLNSTAPFITLACSALQGSDCEFLSISRFGIRDEGEKMLIAFTLTQQEWHHLCVRYSSSRKEVNVVYDGKNFMNATKTFTEMKSDALVLLGQNLDGGERFVGEISLVQLYRSPIEDEIIHNMAYNCSVWLETSDSRTGDLVVDWDQFTSINKRSVVVIVRTPGICASNPCLPGQSCSPSKRDKFNPKVENCPPNQHIYTEQMLTVVEWSPSEVEDMFSDDDFIADFRTNYRSGDVFPWGEFRIMNIAVDSNGNIGVCQFDVVVSPYNCEEPGQPWNGSARVFDSPGDEARRVATLECDQGYLFAEKMPMFFTCDIMGQWARKPKGLNFRFPACSAYKEAVQTVTGSLTVDSKCGNIATVETDLRKSISKASENISRSGGRGFCKFPGCNDELQITTNCGSRPKRSNEPEKIEIGYVLVVNSTRHSLEGVVGNAVRAKYGENSPAPNGTWNCSDEDYPMLHSDDSDDTVSCIQCTVGEYYNETQKVCVPCPANTYKNVAGKGNCTQCANNKITGTTGARLPSDCYDRCDPGHYYDRKKQMCSACPVGSYQPDSGSLSCSSCKRNRATWKEGAENLSDCNVTCDAGTEMKEDFKCMNCAAGTYRPENEKVRSDPNSEDTSCEKCNRGFSSAEKSTSPKDCKIVDCELGTFVNVRKKPPFDQTDTDWTYLCELCPLGKYQDLRNQSSCIDCPEGSTTLKPGAPSMRECLVDGSTPKPTFVVPVPHSGGVAPWITWLIVGIVGALAAIILATFVIVFRKRLRNLMYCCKTDLKTVERTDIYRHSVLPFPIVTSNSTSPSATMPQNKPNEALPPQMNEIYDQIVNGLRTLVDGSDDSRARDFEDVEPVPRERLTVDTSLRAAVDVYGPKAIGLDSSGLPIDSGDYEKLGYGRRDFGSPTDMGIGETFGTFIDRHERSWDEDSCLRRRFDAISHPYNSALEANDWNRKSSFNDYQPNHSSSDDNYSDNFGQTALAADEDDDEDYFG